MPLVERNALLRRVGRRVAEIRESAGLTQAQLAELMDVTTAYLQRIEVGKHNLSLLALDRIGGVLGVDPKAFFLKPRSLVPRGPGRPRKAR